MKQSQEELENKPDAEDEVQSIETNQANEIEVDPDLGYKVHPFADVFPMMKGAKLDELVEDIRKNGLEEGIEYIECRDWDGEPLSGVGLVGSVEPSDEHDRLKVLIVDGRNRLRACRIAGVTPHFWESDSRSDEELLAHIWSKNFHRRQLNPSQRVMLATEHQGFIDAITKANAQRRKATQGRPKKGAKKTEGNVAPSKKTADAIADAANVSPRTAKDALAVQKSGDDKLIEDVKAGKTSVSKAAKQVREKKAPPKKPAKEPVTEDGDYKAAAKRLRRVYDRLCDSLGSADPVCAMVNKAIQLADQLAEEGAVQGEAEAAE